MDCPLKSSGAICSSMSLVMRPTFYVKIKIVLPEQLVVLNASNPLQICCVNFIDLLCVVRVGL